MLDLTRPLIIRKAKDGSDVYMHKDEPGLYWDAHGRSVPEDVAATAGFKVSEERRAKLLAEAEEKARIAREQRVDEEIAKEAQDKSQGTKPLVVDGTSFVLQGNGKGRFDIYADGKKINDKMLLEVDVEPFAKAWLAK